MLFNTKSLQSSMNFTSQLKLVIFQVLPSHMWLPFWTVEIYTINSEDLPQYHRKNIVLEI